MPKKEKVEVYAVGGFVRDRLLGIKKKEADIDFVVLGSGLEFAKKIRYRIERVLRLCSGQGR